MPKSRVSLVLLVTWLAVSSANACSFFVIHDGTQILAGNNEDFWNPNTWVWYVPAETTKYGCVYFGYGNGFPQGGMNDQGLFYDGAATKPLPVKNSSGKKKLPLAQLFTTVMEECENVEQVIALLSGHDLSDFAPAQMLYADATGDSVLVEGDQMIRGSGNYQITTNFYQSLVTNGQIPCERYKTIDRMLSAAEKPSVDLVRNTLAAVHQEGPGSTQYSNIYDLVNLRIYLYHFHNFEEVVTIDLAEELAKGKHESRIRDLFNEGFAARTYRLQHDRKQKKKLPIPLIALRSSTITLVIGSLVSVIVAVTVGRLMAGQVWKGILGGTLGALLGGSGTWLIATLIHALTSWPEYSFFLGNEPELAIVPLLAIILASLGAIVGAVIGCRPKDKTILAD